MCKTIETSQKRASQSGGVVAPAQLTTGSIEWSLVRMAGAMMIGFVAGAAFNVTDTYFVSRLGTETLAAMAFTFPVVMVVFGVTMGVGVGVTAVISRAIGTGQTQRVQTLTWDALLLGVVCVGVFVAVGLGTMRPLFTRMGADEATLPLVIRYMRIWYLGMLFLIVPIIGNCAIRATGDMFSPSLIMIADLGLNIVLDPLLIFGIGPFPALGIEGAAIATVVSRAVALMASLTVLRWKGLLRLRRPNVGHVLTSWKEVAYIGLPAGMAHLAMPLAMAVVVRVASTFGTPAVAAISAAMRIEHGVVIPIFALGAALIPFAGQNLGAGRIERIQGAHKAANRLCLLWGLVCIVGFWFVREPVARIFTRDVAVYRYLLLYLTIVPFVFGVRGLSHSAASIMNGVHQPYHAAGATFLRTLALQVPLVVLGGWLFGFVGLLCALVLTELLAGGISVAWLRNLLSHSVQQLSVVPVTSRNG
ncbi:MAG: MATE family efflux transporter [Sedimentisphaerales bacterium]|nr:MATE family efflux transporter [Sedimentisphaerales bacterium]